MKINKSLEAFLRGYLFFKVNNKYFFLYKNALAKRKQINKDVIFTGFHIFKGWRCFFFRACTDKFAKQFLKQV